MKICTHSYKIICVNCMRYKKIRKCFRCKSFLYKDYINNNGCYKCSLKIKEEICVAHPLIKNLIYIVLEYMDIKFTK